MLTREQMDADARTIAFGEGGTVVTAEYFAPGLDLDEDPTASLSVVIDDGFLTELRGSHGLAIAERIALHVMSNDLDGLPEIQRNGVFELPPAIVRLAWPTLTAEQWAAFTAEQWASFFETAASVEPYREFFLVADVRNRRHPVMTVIGEVYERTERSHDVRIQR